MDINDNPPLFLQDNYTFELKLPADLEQSFGTVQATDIDVDENAQLSYKIKNDPGNQFRIDSKQGTLYANVINTV